MKQLAAQSRFADKCELLQLRFRTSLVLWRVSQLADSPLGVWFSQLRAGNPFELLFAAA